MIPVGWDSWGKIGVLRDGFNAKSWGDAWENDLESQEGEGSARTLYANLVAFDHASKVCNLLNPCNYI
jgi:dynein light intermediate chain 1